MCAPGDVLVMATHGLGHETWPIGGVAGMLVRAAPVPVLLVRTAPPRDLELAPVSPPLAGRATMTAVGA